MWNNKLRSLLLVGLLFLIACKQSPPPKLEPVEEKGDIYFSGYHWNYKNATNPVGPGPNRFLGTSEAVWVDSSGYLHLRIFKKNNFWYCSELISTKEFGYGTYTFTCLTDIRDFNEKNVFGFFTWNIYSFQSDGNSEIDVEFSRWNNANDSLLITYAVQPVSFSNPVPYQERTFKPSMATLAFSQPTTHMMRWTEDSVYWESYKGEVYPGTEKIGTWSFDRNNIPRNKIEGSNVSDPIIIPKPRDSTNVRMNYWLLNGQAPTNLKDYEIVIKSFSFSPL
jgi:hypothetical protein